MRPPRFSPPKTAPPPTDGRSAVRRVGRARAKADAPSRSAPHLPAYGRTPSRLPPRPRPPKWEPCLRRREEKRPNGAPPHHNAHTPNAERKRYLHNSRTKTQRRTERCAQFVIFIFTLCKLLHNFSTVLHRSPRNLPKRAQIAARRPDLPCFTFPSRAGSPKIVMKNRPTSAPIEPRKPPRFAPALSRPRDAITRLDLCILHVFNEIRREGRCEKIPFSPRRRPKKGVLMVSSVKKRPPNEEKHVFIWTISNLTNTFAP